MQEPQESFQPIADEANRFFHTNNYKAAIEALQKAQPRWGDTPEFLALLGAAYLANNQVAEAEACLRRSNEIEPKFGTQFNLAECAFARRDYALASMEFRTAYTQAPDIPAYRGIAAFKVVISDRLRGAPEIESAEHVQSLTATGKFFLEVYQSILDGDASGALERLSAPEGMTAEGAPYRDTLRTGEIILEGE